MWLSKDKSSQGWCNLWRAKPIALFPSDGSTVFMSVDPTELSTTLFDPTTAEALIGRELQPGECVELVCTEVIG